jgi:regulatory protein
MPRIGGRPPRREAAVGGAPAPDAYTTGLTLLARRELSTEQVRAALLRRGCPEPDVERALERLTREAALDDARTARAYARTAATLKHRGRQRITRELQALGLDRDLARAAVNETLDESAEEALLDQAIARRIRGPIRDERELRRYHAWLIRQGFPPDRVRARLRSLAAGTDLRDDEEQ